MNEPTTKREVDIEHEVGDYWVLRIGLGKFEVYESGATHSIRVASVTFKSDPERGRARAIHEANRRAEAVRLRAPPD